MTVPATEITSDPRQPSRFEKNANTPVNRASGDSDGHLIYLMRNLAHGIHQPFHFLNRGIAGAAGADDSVFRAT